MGFSDFFFGGNDITNDELPDIFPMAITRTEFVQADLIHTFVKILTDVAERTHGLTPEMQFLLWDNCVKSNASMGLISTLAHAMTDKRDLFLVYDRAVGILREADNVERQAIEADYKKQAGSNVGIYVSFQKYKVSDLIRVFSALEYASISSLNKAANVSTALQFRISDLRAGVGLADSAVARAQAKAMATALGKGKNILMDAKDEVMTGQTDMEPLKATMQFLNQKRSWYLGLPESYIAGIQTNGMGATGEGDQKATERGLKNYFFSVMKPVLESLFGVPVTYKSQDFRQVDQGLQALQTFSITEDDLMTRDEKRLIIAQLFDFDDEGGGDLP